MNHIVTLFFPTFPITVFKNYHMNTSDFSVKMPTTYHNIVSDHDEKEVYRHVDFSH